MIAEASILDRVSRNIGWLLAEKALRLAVSLFVGGWTARYLAPEQFGLFHYSLALVALFGILANAGLDSIVVRDLVRNPGGRDETLGSAFLLKLIGGFLSLAASLAASLLLEHGDARIHWMVALMALALLVQAFDTVDLWFQSQIQSRPAVIARQTAFVVLAAVKILLILLGAPLIAFAWVVLGESVLAAACLILAYRLNRNRILDWRGSIVRMRELLAHCWPLLLAGMMIGIYLRIDQVMLGRIAGIEAVGIYSAGIMLSELWYAVPTAIVASAAPVLARTRESDPALFRRQLTLLFRILALISIAVAVPVSLLGEHLVVLVFGDAYRAAGPVLSVHIWASLFVALGMASSQYLVLENLTRISLQRTLAGAVVNVALNLVWIPLYGPVGAAWATLVSYAVATLFLFHNRLSRPCLWLMLRALWPFPRLSA